MKRFRDTNKMDKAWYMELPPRLKCAVDFVHDKCDNAGVWDINLPVLNMHVNDSNPVNLDELLTIADGTQFKLITPRKIYSVGFITFQYGKLSENSLPHKRILELINKHNINYHELDRVLSTLKEEEKEGTGKRPEEEKAAPGFLKTEMDRNIHELQTDQLFHEQVCMALSISMEEMKKFLDQFISEKTIGYELNKSLNECRRHFRDWTKIQIEKKQRKETVGSVLAGTFPDYYNPKFEATLQGQRLSAYWQHLNSKGFKPIKKKINGIEKVVDWVKAA